MVRRRVCGAADGGEVTVVVGHRHVMHVAAVAVVVAEEGRRRFSAQALTING